MEISWICVVVFGEDRNKIEGKKGSRCGVMKKSNGSE
jgi:hypothetical protein